MELIMKPITVWLRLDEKKQQWNHNHIEDGHVPIVSTKPIGTPHQTKVWSKGTWSFQHKHLDMNNTVV